MEELVIRDADVVDGSGDHAYRADVVVDGGRITGIVKEAADAGCQRPRARRELDAEGLVLAPGFIDMHAHSDLALLRGLGAVVGVAQEGEVAVGVHVDEAGGEDEPLRVQLTSGRGTLAARVGRLLDDRDDPPAVDHHVRAVGVSAAAVDDVRVPDDQVFHALPPAQKNVRM